jgi:hypothetical protein
VGQARDCHTLQHELRLPRESCRSYVLDESKKEKMLENLPQ